MRLLELVQQPLFVKQPLYSCHSAECRQTSLLFHTVLFSSETAQQHALYPDAVRYIKSIIRVVFSLYAMRVQGGATI